MTSNTKHTVAVYGSLRAGLHNHPIISSGERQEDTTLSGSVKMVDLGSFPGVVNSSSLDYNKVKVEVYNVDDSTFDRLDMLEGNGSFYTRELVTLDNGTEAWVYFLPTDYLHYDEVESGDWASHKGVK